MKQSKGMICGLLLKSAVLTAGALLAGQGMAQGIAVSNDQTIAFLGDSITQQGGTYQSGYCQLVVSGLAANGIKVKMIAAGISGHKSNDMRARLAKDVLDKKPEWMTLSCGVNDVWHGTRGIPLDDYKTNIVDIIDRAQAAGIRVMILTATMITEDAKAENNRKLASYNEFLRSLAAEKKCLLADLNADMQKAVAQGRAKGKTGNLLTVDGVHMNLDGNQMMAIGVLRSFGLTDEQIQKAKDFWMDVPDLAVIVVPVKMTLRQYTQLQGIAELRTNNLVDMLKSNAETMVQEILKSGK